MTAADLTTWAPILSGDLRDEAMAAVDSIASALSRPHIIPPDNASLASGSAGLALFFTTLAEAQPQHGDTHAERALELVSDAIDTLAERLHPPSLYGGFTGVAWAADIVQRHFGNPDDPDLNADIDDALVAFVARAPWDRDYDLITGLAGFGVYALRRMPRTAANAALASIVDRLEETAISTADGITWFTPQRLLSAWQRDRYPNGYYNLGLAHGVPGVIVLLAQVCAAGVALTTARPLLDNAVAWLLAQRRPLNSESSFGTVVPDDIVETEPFPTRIAWCYGDLGIATALLCAARLVGEKEWERQAIAIATRAAERSLDRSGVVDAGLCHGSAGNAHLFNRLYQATREPLFLHAARIWVEQTLARRRPGEGVGGFLAWRPAPETWSADPGLLEGAAGIGLALLAASASTEPEWDRMLMVAIPPEAALP